MNSSIEEFSTPRINTEGEGDGLKNISVRRRAAVPSARKFNSRCQPDEKLQLKLEDALADAQARPKPKSHSCLAKSKTVAEITPTKSRVRKRPVKLISTDNDDCIAFTVATLHATPRPMDSTPTDPAASRRCPKDWAVCTVYQRLLLCVWRRCRERRDALTEECGRQQNQIHQLEVQVDFLKSMRTAESEKRNEALNECQRLKKQMDVLTKENSQLIQELKNVQEEMCSTKKHLKLAKCDLKKCSEQLGKLESQLKKRKEEKLDLLAKISSQDQDLTGKNITISRLEEAVKRAERNLQDSEANVKKKGEELIEALRNLQNEVDSNFSMKEEISLLREEKVDLENHSRFLEDQLECYMSNSIDILEEKEKAWYYCKTKDIAAVSLAALQQVAEIVFPIYRRY